MSPEIETKAELKLALLGQIGKGKQKALTGQLLAQRLGFKNDRSIRYAIRELIADGHPIAASVAPPLGFYIAETKAEVEGYLADLKGRLVNDAYRRRDFRRAARKILQPEQLQLAIGGKQ